MSGSARGQSETPLVSVLTPSFNQAAWLEDNLRSVARQTYPRIEHIVMDGGSTDGSVEILDSAEPPVVWSSEPDEGQSHALNKAYSVSSGDIIGWLNSDDAYYGRDVIERIVRYFAQHPHVDVVYGHAARVNARGRFIGIARAPRFRLKTFRWFDYLIQPTVFLRRSVLPVEALVDERFQFAMDYKLFLDLANSGCRFARVNRVIAIDRLHGTRKSQTWAHVADTDVARLAAEGSMDGFPSWLHRVWGIRHVWMRLAAVPQVLMLPSEPAFHWVSERRIAMLWRQVLVRRSRMPEEERWL